MRRSTLGSCIRTLRIRNQMTQAQLADKIGVTDKAVSKWERGLSYPDIELFPVLADILQVTVNDLLRECEDECRPSQLLQRYEMSRDIRTPLHIILGFVEIAKNNLDDEKMLLRYLEGIKVSGEFLMKKLDGLDHRSVAGTDAAADDRDDLNGSDDLEDYLQERIAAAQQHPVRFDFSGKRILIAEDLAINREIASEIIRQTGAETVFAEDGQICLEMVEAAPGGTYDMILMDIMMPNMDGLEATRRIRELDNREKAGIPIVAMTTNTDAQSREAAARAGMNGFTEKPVSVDRLFSEMARHLS